MSSPDYGWRYPPGCSGPPEDAWQCQVCLSDEDECRCPACPRCGRVGESDCYLQLAPDRLGHGLLLSRQQMEERRERMWTDLGGCPEPLFRNLETALSDQEALAMDAAEEASASGLTAPE